MDKKIIAIAVIALGLVATFVVFGIVLLTRGVSSEQEANTSTGDVLLQTDNSTNYSLINWHIESALGAVIVSLISLTVLNAAYKRIKNWWRGRTPATLPVPPPVAMVSPTPLMPQAQEQSIPPQPLLLQDLPPTYRSIHPRRRQRMSTNPRLQSVRYVVNPAWGPTTLPPMVASPDFDMQRLEAQIRQVMTRGREEDSENEDLYEMEEESASLDRARDLAGHTAALSDIDID